MILRLQERYKGEIIIKYKEDVKRELCEYCEDTVVVHVVYEIWGRLSGQTQIIPIFDIQ